MMAALLLRRQARPFVRGRKRQWHSVLQSHLTRAVGVRRFSQSGIERPSFLQAADTVTVRRRQRKTETVQEFDFRSAPADVEEDKLLYSLLDKLEDGPAVGGDEEVVEALKEKKKAVEEQRKALFDDLEDSPSKEFWMKHFLEVEAENLRKQEALLTFMNRSREFFRVVEQELAQFANSPKKLKIVHEKFSAGLEGLSPLFKRWGLPVLSQEEMLKKGPVLIWEEMERELRRTERVLDLHGNSKLREVCVRMTEEGNVDPNLLLDTVAGILDIPVTEEMKEITAKFLSGAKKQMEKELPEDEVEKNIQKIQRIATLQDELKALEHDRDLNPEEALKFEALTDELNKLKQQIDEKMEPDFREVVTYFEQTAEKQKEDTRQLFLEMAEKEAAAMSTALPRTAALLRDIEERGEIPAHQLPVAGAAFSFPYQIEQIAVPRNIWWQDLRVVRRIRHVRLTTRVSEMGLSPQTKSILRTLAKKYIQGDVLKLVSRRFLTQEENHNQVIMQLRALVLEADRLARKFESNGVEEARRNALEEKLLFYDDHGMVRGVRHKPAWWEEGVAAAPRGPFKLHEVAFPNRDRIIDFVNKAMALCDEDGELSPTVAAELKGLLKIAPLNRDFLNWGTGAFTSFVVRTSPEPVLEVNYAVEEGEEGGEAFLDGAVDIKWSDVLAQARERPFPQGRHSERHAMNFWADAVFECAWDRALQLKHEQKKAALELLEGLLDSEGLDLDRLTIRLRGVCQKEGDRYVVGVWEKGDELPLPLTQAINALTLKRPEFQLWHPDLDIEPEPLEPEVVESEELEFWDALAF